MNKLYHFQMAIKEVKELENGVVHISGLASTPDIDRYNDIVEPEAFAEALTMFSKNPTLLRSHNADCPCGNVTMTKVTDQGLYIEADVTEARTVDDVVNNRMRAFSIGYCPQVTELRHKDGTPFNQQVDDPWDKDIVRVIKKLDLVEISIVSTPANGNALFSVAKSVKKYFSQLAVKSMSEKSIDDEPIDNEINIDEAEPVLDTPAVTEIPADDIEEPVVDEPEIIEPIVEPAIEEPAAEGEEKITEPTDGNEPVGENTDDEAENGAEIAPAESGEAGKSSDEPNADAENGKIATDELPKDDKSVISVTDETAKSLHEFVAAGLFIESKDAGAVNIPEPVRVMLKNLLGSYAIEMKKAQERIDGLNKKLENVPEKRSLKVTVGQFDDKNEVKTDGKKVEKTKLSPDFKALFNIND